MNHNWNYPTLIWVGENRVNNLTDGCKELKISNPLFVTDKDLITLPMTVQIIENLKQVFKDIKIFSNFSGNPFGKNITDGVDFFNKYECDGVIAFGGGSALDVGKGLSLIHI